MAPGNGGPFTETDHVAVLGQALAQIPVTHWSDLLVTIDGTGSSHAVVEHLSGWNTHRGYGRRGWRTECSIGWSLDARALGAIDRIPEQAWSAGLAADGRADPAP